MAYYYTYSQTKKGEGVDRNHVHGPFTLDKLVDSQSEGDLVFQRGTSTFEHIFPQKIAVVTDRVFAFVDEVPHFFLRKPLEVEIMISDLSTGYLPLPSEHPAGKALISYGNDGVEARDNLARMIATYALILNRDAETQDEILHREYLSSLLRPHFFDPTTPSHALTLVPDIFHLNHIEGYDLRKPIEIQLRRMKIGYYAFHTLPSSDETVCIGAKGLTRRMAIKKLAFEFVKQYHTYQSIDPDFHSHTMIARKRYFEAILVPQI